MLTHHSTCPACGERTEFQPAQLTPSGNINLAAVRAAARGEPFHPKVDVRLFRFYGMTECALCSAPLELLFQVDASALERLAREYAPQEWESVTEWDEAGWLNLGNAFKEAQGDVAAYATGGAEGVTLRKRPGAGG